MLPLRGSEAYDRDRDRGTPGIEVAIRVPLVAAEYEDVAGFQGPPFACRYQFHAPALAGQVFARARRVGHADHPAARLELHARDFQARDGLGQQRPKPCALALAFTDLAGAVELGARARRADLRRRAFERGNARPASDPSVLK